MEPKTSVWKANLNSGLILGLIAVVYSLVMYFMDLSFNKVQGYVFWVLLVFLLFYLIRTYRNTHLNGYMTYGQAVGVGVIICLYYAIITAVFTYILYAYIDPELSKKQLAFMEEVMQKKGMTQEIIDATIAMQAKFLKPAILAPFSILGTMFFGTIITLVVSIFIKKEGNPLVDEAEKL